MKNKGIKLSSNDIEAASKFAEIFSKLPPEAQEVAYQWISAMAYFSEHIKVEKKAG